MREKRRHKRHTRRFKVRYGQRGFEHTAFTSDVSASGMFIVGPAPKLDTRIHLEVVVDASRSIFYEGVVQRLAVAPPELRQVTRSGFGVRFLTGTELFNELLPQTKGQLCARYRSMEDLDKAFEQEIRRGGVFLQSSKPPPVNSLVSVDLEVLFVGETVSVEARVVHTVPQPGGAVGVAVVFTDGPHVIGTIARLLGKAS